MPHPHANEFSILDHVYRAEIGEAKLSRRDRKNFVRLFMDGDKLLNDGDLNAKIKLLNSIIKQSFSGLHQTELRHEIVFVMLHERKALEKSFSEASKAKYLENLAILEKVHEQTLDALPKPKRRLR